MENKVTIVMPAFNESQAIGICLDGLMPLAEQNGWQVLVINDGSTDDTGKIATEKGAVVINHWVNSGYGASLKTGIKAADGDIVVIMDADGQHNKDDIARLLEHIDDYDMVVGKRTKASHKSWLRKPGKWILMKVANLLCRTKIPDLNSGLRAYRKDLLLKLIHLMPDGFSFSTTSTVAYNSMKFRVKYIPITVAKRIGTSSVRQFKHGFETLLLMLRLIVLFNPLKIFLPVSLAFIATSIAYQFFIIFREGLHVHGGAVVSFVAGMQMFLFGLMIDQISAIRREKYL